MTQLMHGKRGLIMGVANDHSIAWGIAKTLAAHGATLAFTYQGEALGRRVKPLAAVGRRLACAALRRRAGRRRSTPHSPPSPSSGARSISSSTPSRFPTRTSSRAAIADTTRENFVRTMLISCFSFTEVAKRAAALMPAGGAMVTLTYNGGQRAMPNYNVMGVAKAALEASVRYLAVDFGRPPSASTPSRPVRCARWPAPASADARLMFNFQQRHSPLRRGVTLEEIGGAALYLLSDLSTGVTGDIHFVDSGYNVIAMPHPAALKDGTRRRPPTSAPSPRTPRSSGRAARRATFGKCSCRSRHLRHRRADGVAGAGQQLRGTDRCAAMARACRRCCQKMISLVGSPSAARSNSVHRDRVGLGPGCELEPADRTRVARLRDAPRQLDPQCDRPAGSAVSHLDPAPSAPQREMSSTRLLTAGRPSGPRAQGGAVGIVSASAMPATQNAATIAAPTGPHA